MSLPHTLHIGRPDGVINWRMPLRLLLVNLSLLALCLAMAVAALCYGTLQLSLEQVFAALSGEAPKKSGHRGHPMALAAYRHGAAVRRRTRHERRHLPVDYPQPARQPGRDWL